MNEKLIVKNFGPIRKAELDLKKVTVFIGPQGSGKSTLAKLVAICKDGYALTDFQINRSPKNQFIKYQAEFFLNSDTDIYFESDNYNISFKSFEEIIFNTKKDNVFDGKTFELFPYPTLQSMKNAWKGVQERMARGTTNANSIFLTQVLPFFQYKINELTSNVKYLTTDRLVVSSISDSIYGLLNSDVSLQKTTTGFGNFFEIARSNIPNLFINYLDVTYKYENGRNFVYHNETDSIPLSTSASGYQSTIPLHLTIEHFAKEENTFFIVEEPELNIFPITQKALIGYLADRCTKGNNSLFINTHSPYVLTALNNLIFAYQVAEVLPERADEIAKIVPREQWLNPDDVAAYYVGEDENGEKGGIHSIFNRKTGLIGQNELDEVSDELGDEFSALMNIYRTRKRETVN